MYGRQRMIVENRDRKEFRLPHSNRCVSPWPDPALDTMALNIITHEQAPKSDKQTDPQDVEPCQDPPLGQIGRKSGVFNVIISGLALLSDGYNAQISKSNLLLVSVMFMTNSFSWIHGAPLLRFVCIDTTVFRPSKASHLLTGSWLDTRMACHQASHRVSRIHTSLVKLLACSFLAFSLTVSDEGLALWLPRFF